MVPFDDVIRHYGIAYLNYHEKFHFISTKMRFASHEAYKDASVTRGRGHWETTNGIDDTCSQPRFADPKALPLDKGSSTRYCLKVYTFTRHFTRYCVEVYTCNTIYQQIDTSCSNNLFWISSAVHNGFQSPYHKDLWFCTHHFVTNHFIQFLVMERTGIPGSLFKYHGLT